MSTNDEGIVVTVDAKRLIAITILAVITISTLYSYIIALFAFVAPYPGTYLFDVKEADTYDTSNVLEDTFSKGSTVRVKAKVEKATDYYTTMPPPYTYTSLSGLTSYRVYITIKAPDDSVVKFYTDTGSFAPGGSVPYTVDAYIASGAPAGTYNVQVLVWSDKLPDGSSHTPTVEEFTFTVL